MALDPQQELRVVDASGTWLGSVATERIEGQRLIGRFDRTDSFDKVWHLFKEMEDAVFAQLFHDVDRIEGEINKMGLRLISPDGSESIKVQDVQIMSGTNFSCHVPNLAIVQLEPSLASAT